MRRPWVLGIAASQHNGAACLMRGDDIVVAIQEERITRLKRQGICGARPSQAFEYCLEAAGLTADSLDLVVLCTQTSSKTPEHDCHKNPRLVGLARQRRTRIISHHFGHALSAVGWAGTRNAAVLVVDGLGSPLEDLPDNERALAAGESNGASESISMYRARGWHLQPLAKYFADQQKWLKIRRSGMPGFQSLGGMYAAVAHKIFGDAMEAGKVMGLASHGKASIPVDRFLKWKNARVEFSNRVPRKFADLPTGQRVASLHKDLAASVQVALEEALLHLARALHKLTAERCLCFAGGVALNAMANDRLIRESGFERLHVLPAADDAGTAFGAALAGLLELGWPIRHRAIRGDEHGRRYGDTDILSAIDAVPGLRYTRRTDIIAITAARLARGQICGWFQGGAEFGPRALGQRSILGDPRDKKTKSRLDTNIKRREKFRPYAPAVLRADVTRWFQIGPNKDTPFMLRVMPVREGRCAKIPAVVHVDGTARVQTVTARSGKFFQLIKSFKRLTGIPMLLNTSFNARGEPIVETVEDALWRLADGGLDFCVVANWLFERDTEFRSIRPTKS
jgi:carbamoyltransferase